MFSLRPSLLGGHYIYIDSSEDDTRGWMAVRGWLIRAEDRLSQCLITIALMAPTLLLLTWKEILLNWLSEDTFTTGHLSRWQVKASQWGASKCLALAVILYSFGLLKGLSLEREDIFLILDRCFSKICLIK